MVTAAEEALEALRTILSMATTDLPGKPAHIRDGRSERRTQISAVDISRAYFNAATDDDKPTYVMLPKEDPDHAGHVRIVEKAHEWNSCRRRWVAAGIFKLPAQHRL